MLNIIFNPTTMAAAVIASLLYFGSADLFEKYGENTRLSMVIEQNDIS